MNDWQDNEPYRREGTIGKGGRAYEIDIFCGQWAITADRNTAGDVLYGVRAIVWDKESQQRLFAVDGFTWDANRQSDLVADVSERAHELLLTGAWRRDSQLLRAEVMRKDYMAGPPPASITRGE
jgi:hypothetical protein